MANELKLRVVMDAMDRVTAPLQKIRGGAGQAGQALKGLRDRMKDLEAAQKSIGEFREVSRGLATTRTQLSQAQGRVKALAQEMHAVSAPTKAMRREFASAVKSAQALSQQHDQQRLKLQEVRNTMSAAGLSTRNLSQTERALRTDIAGTNRQIDVQRERLNRLAEQTRKVAQARQQFEKTRAFAGNAAMVGASAGAVGYGVLRGSANILREGLSFEQTISKVQALTGVEKGSDEWKALRQQARDLGASTMFTATEAAQGQAFLGMAGFKPKDIIAAMPGVLDVAKAGGLKIAETADIASNILTGFGLASSDMTRVGDVLTSTFTRSNTTMQMLGETMKYVAPNAAAYGQSLETVAAAAGILGNAGIQASMGGTALRSILGRLAAPPKDAADALAKLNIQVADAQGNMRDLPDILKEVHEKTKMMGNIERGTLIKAIAGERAVSSMTVLVDKAGTGELQDFIQKTLADDGAARKKAKDMADNLTGDLDQLFSAWADVKIELFDVNNGVLRSTVKMLTGIVNAVGAWAKRNPKLVATISKIIAVIGVLAAAISGIALSLAAILVPMAAVKFAAVTLGIKMGGAFTVFRTAFTMLRSALPVVLTLVRSIGVALAASPIGIVVTAIATAALLIYRYWQPIRAFFRGVFQGIAAALAPVGEVLAEVGQVLAVVFSPLIWLFRKIGSTISAVIDWIGRLFAPSEQSAESLESITSAGQRVGEVLGAVFRILLVPLRIFAAIAQGIALLITGQWSELGDFLGDIWSGLGNIASAAWDGVTDVFSGLWGSMRDGATDVVSAIGDTLSSGASAVTSTASAAWNGVTDMFSGLWDGVRNGVGGVVSAVGDTLSSGASTVTSTASAAWDGLTGVFSNLWNNAQNNNAAGIKGINQAISDMSPLPLLKSAFSRAMSWLGIDLPEEFSQAGENIMSGLVKGIKSMGNSVKNAVTGMGQDVMNWFQGKLGIQSPSRVFIGYGENVSEGTGIGIDQGASAPLKSMRAMAAAVAAAGVMAPIAAPAIVVPAAPTFAVPEQQISDALVRPQLDTTALQDKLFGIRETFRSPIVDIPGIAMPVVAPKLPTPVTPVMPTQHLDVLVRPLLDQAAMQGVLAQIRTAFDSALARTHGIVADITTDLRIDARPPVAAATQRAPITFGGDTIHINITVPHGADPQAIASAVRAELDRRDRARSARMRSAMTDYGA